MKKNSADSVTRDEFREAMQGIDHRFDKADQKAHNLALHLLNLQAQMASDKEELSRQIQTGIHQVLSVIDSFKRDMETYDRKTVLSDARLKELDVRVTCLESKNPH